MNKKITFSFLFLLSFLTINLQATSILKICVNTQLDDPVGLVEFITSGTDATQIDNDINGCYQFEVEDISGTLNLSLSKDVNTSNGVDVADIMLMRDFILSIAPASPFQQLASDINQSNATTTLDLVLFSRMILGIPIPDVESWKFVEPMLNPQTGSPVAANEIEIATPISGGTMTINVLGIKMGDMDFDADPSMFTSPTADDRTGDLIFKTNNQAHLENEVFEVPITSENFSQIRGFQLTSQFDADQLEFQEIILGNLPDHSLSDINLENTDEGFINMLWINSEVTGIDLNANDILFSIRFKAKTNINLDDIFEINSFSTTAVAYDTGLEASEIMLVIEDAVLSNNDLNKSAELKPNYPNPFQVTTQIGYTLENTSEVRLEITDALGNHIETLVNEKQNAGEYQVIFTPSNLPNGIYFGKLTVGENTMVQKLIYLR